MNTYSYLFLDSAQQEYEDAINWYLERSLQATQHFVDAVDHTLELICGHPDRWRNEYRKYYELGVKGYPYNIIYTIAAENDQIVIHAVYHHSRNPKKKYIK